MGNFYRTILSALLALSLCAVAGPQQAVPPPPKPAPEQMPPSQDSAQNGPTLAETMTFIQEKMKNQGVVEYRDPSAESYEIKDVTTNSGSCTFKPSVYSVGIGPHYSGWQYTVSASFKDISEISVTLHEGTEPPVFRLTVKGDGAFFKIHDVSWDDGRKNEADRSVSQVDFTFRDEALANRVAKAMLHAVELCNVGKKPEPF